MEVTRSRPWAALAQTRPVWLEVEDDGALAGFELGALPHRALEIQQVVEEHQLAPVDTEFALFSLQSRHRR